MKKIINILLGIVTLFAFAVTPALAHVVVKPDTAGVAVWQTFTIGVPNERDNPTIAIKLLIPDGLKSVSPNVKPGWTIEVKKSGEGEDAKVTEIDWTAGSIPSGQRDDFLFQAQVPASETTLNWKAYQTYQDGTVISWDQTPDPKMSDDEREKMEKKNLGPYSQTKIVNDLTGSTTTVPVMADSLKKTSFPLGLSILAIVLSVASLAVALRKK